MSTFSGIIKEIPNISIDRFDNNNLKSKTFFLSHCHTDHMIGLDNPDGLRGPLYVSPISAVILQKKYKHLINIKCLEIGVPTVIPYDYEHSKDQHAYDKKIDNDGDHPDRDDEDTSQLSHLVVTTIPAGHCPGSIMFLFELNNLKILYTGDFRLQIKDIIRVAAFKDSAGCVLPIDNIYFDSTFFTKDYEDFPLQCESASAICDLIAEWIARGLNYVISLKISARYGSEYLFKMIYERTGKRIHVNDFELENYRYIPELDDCVTNENPHTLQIHACYQYGNNFNTTLSCRQMSNKHHLRLIRPSALIWKNWKYKSSPIYTKIIDKEIYRVCYSNHSGFTEIKAFLKYLKPNAIELNVIADRQEDQLKQRKCLLEILSELKFHNLGFDKIPETLMSPLPNFNFTNIQNVILQNPKHGKKTIDKLYLEDNDAESVLMYDKMPKRSRKKL